MLPLIRQKPWLFTLLILSGCQESTGVPQPMADAEVTQYNISSNYAVQSLTNSVYQFPAIDPDTRESSIQPLERFDLIFVGHDPDDDSSTDQLSLARIIPGTYTHMLAYIGKDSQGFAYGLEMNSSEDQSYSFGLDGLTMNGRLYVYCLGSDYGNRECPVDDYHYGLETYDYRWARQLQPELKASLMEYEDELLDTIRQDLLNGYPFQLPFRVGYETLVTGVVQIIDDGRVNGGDCAAYLLSLFEEVAGVCLNDARMSADEVKAYFLFDPMGQQAVLPARYNVFTDVEEDIPVTDLLTVHGYSLLDSLPRQTTCADGQMSNGMLLPDRIFNSPSLY